MKLTLHHRTEALVARHAGVDPSNEPNRPHISSVTNNFKERQTKQTEMRPNFSARPACLICILVCVALPSVCVSASVWPVVRPARASLRRR
ncbi:MAG TPA: hypothetical protein ENJ52_09560 [Aliiroseovarius sp.]|nr:hypothetical protein [Aliiroseovarius sp.]